MVRNILGERSDRPTDKLAAMLALVRGKCHDSELDARWARVYDQCKHGADGLRITSIETISRFWIEHGLFSSNNFADYSDIHTALKRRDQSCVPQL